MIDYEMRRTRFTQAAEVLQKIIEQPKRAPTRILGATGINYHFLQTLITAGLVEVYGENKHRRLLLTDNGREFLTHYKICRRLLPN